MSNNMKLYVMDNGHNENDYACIVGMPFQLSASNRTPRAEWVCVPVYTVLIEHPDGLVLFDTACHPDSMSERWPEEQKEYTPHYCTDEQLLPNTLKRLGYSPKDINHVVVSHLHEDHAGCLEMFTDSQIYAHDDEFKMTMKMYALNQDRGGYIHKDIEHWIKANLHWNLLSSDEDMIELLDGIHIVNLGSGHTPGLLGLLVSLPKSGNIILTSDAINSSENYGPPVRSPGLIYDSLGFQKCVQKVHKLQAKYDAQVWFGHDSVQFAALIKSDQGYYD